MDSIFVVLYRADKRILLLFESGAFSIKVEWLEQQFEWPLVDLVEELVHLLLISVIILVIKDLRL